VVQLGDEIIEALRQPLDDGDRYQFAVGDFISEILEEFDHIKRSDLIKQMADRTGADRSTLRDRHNVAKFYPKETRKEYDMLSYSQLRACKAAGDEWRKYAEWAVKHLPAPVAMIRARIKSNGDNEPYWISRWARMQNIARLIVADADAPEKIKKVCRLVAKQNSKDTT
jgi:hypothetical protein